MADIEDAPKDRVGFGRAEMYSEPLVGTVKTYNTHLFVCSHQSGTEWAHDTTKDATGAHAKLDATLTERREQLPAAFGKPKTTLFVAEAGDRPGDVLVFPANKRLRPVADMVAAPDAWATEVVSLLASGAGDTLPAGCAHVFVCVHARRDKRCGVCGPALIDALRSRQRAGVEVRACSHVGGHAYAGNVLVFAARAGSDGVTGDWYGYVTPSDVDALLDVRIGNGANLPKLWRGAMGMTPEQCTAACAGCT